MTQTLALLLDAYRDLNARKLFWITLILSTLVIVALSFLGVSGQNLTLLGFHLDMSPYDPMERYKTFFSYIILGMWLTLAGVALALVSTAGLFPDLISSGAIDLYLSKPISRLRLFLIKYFSGLLFVGLQVTVFSLGSFIVFGVRTGTWKPSLFLAIPLVVLMFSYLFAFCVLFGVWTRSTIAAILLTILLWLGIWGVQLADTWLLKLDTILKYQVTYSRRFIETADSELAATKATAEKADDIKELRKRRQLVADREPEIEKGYAKLHMYSNIVHGVNAIVPKTTQTTDLLDRWLFTDEELKSYYEIKNSGISDRDNPLGINSATTSASETEADRAIRQTSLWYIIGTSLLCEAVVVSLAAWIFCRRDY